MKKSTGRVIGIWLLSLTGLGCFIFTLYGISLMIDSICVCSPLEVEEEDQGTGLEMLIGIIFTFTFGVMTIILGVSTDDIIKNWTKRRD
jgi:hypothetical protein